MTLAFDRRDFLKAAAVLAMSRPTRVLGANEKVRIGVIGIGWKGGDLANDVTRIGDAQLVALADPDPAHRMQSLKEELAKADRPVNVDTYVDYRRLLDRKDIDAVLIASPNHWHVLHSIHALQADKHVYVEKPFSHTIWEGRQLVKLAKKTNKVVETGLQHRSRPCWAQALDYLKQGNLGQVLTARGLCYNLRDGIGKLDAPGKPPASCDYDLWLGPAEDQPLMRPRFHYDWHWVWHTGNGDLSNQGVHQLDVCRHLIGQHRYPEHVFSLGGRLKWDDAGQTPNTQVVYFDYKPVPLIFEVRHLPIEPGVRGVPVFRNTRIGSILECEGGFIAEAAAYDNNGRRLARFDDDGGANHLPNFIQAVRDNRPDKVVCPVEDGHLSSSLSHLGGISYRLGQATSPRAALESVQYNPLAADAWQRCLENLKVNEIDVDAKNVVLGPVLSVDNETESITGQHADLANPLLKRKDRAPWIVPEIV